MGKLIIFILYKVFKIFPVSNKLIFVTFNKHFVSLGTSSMLSAGKHVFVQESSSLTDSRASGN